MQRTFQGAGKGLIFAGLMLTAAGHAWAADYFVDQNNPSASDSNPGTEARPWRTLQRAGTQALQPGDTVYVKAGTYDVRSGGAWNRPAVIPAASGSADKPITFKSLPTHAAVLQASSTNPAIGVVGRSHIVIDGFVVPNPGTKGMAVFNGDNVVIQNNIIHGVYVDSADNTEAVRIENSSNVLVRNNRFYNVRNGGNSSNASAVKTYNTRNVTVEHNLMYDVIAGVKEKYKSTGLTVRFNHIYGCRYGLVLNTQVDGVTENVRYYQNVVECNSPFESATQNGTVLRDVHIYNNTFAGYTSQAVHGTEVGQSMYIYNNIFYRTSSSISMADFFTRQSNTNEIKLFDYNLFLRDPKVVIGMYSTNTTFTSLQSWQRSAYGLSGHDRLGDPLFVDPAKHDFKLRAGSPAIGLGRSGGQSSGAPINAGAYITGNESIGLLTQAPAEVAPPNPPRLLSVD